MFGPVLKGPRVTLRPADEADPPRLVPWFADLEVTRFMGRRTGVSLEYEIDALKRLGESKTDVWWVIDADGGPVGATGIHNIDWQNAHGTTGIVIGVKEKWGRGIASEAMALRTRYAFRELNLHKLMTEAFVDNAASRRALEKAGYRTVGIRREHFFTHGRWHDLWIGELLREDWQRANPS